MSHTPGPWVANGIHVLRGNTILAETFPTSLVGSQGEECANARLIAAAPDLLELCKRALTQSARVHPDFMRDLQDAIAKVEGK